MIVSKVEVWASETIILRSNWDKHGRLVIPVDMRMLLGMMSGDEVLLVAGASEFRIVPGEEARLRENAMPRPLLASSKYA
jgi:bifunctional DNA-binding transcriptional regulator/antitoxin component of YhaV-PrlF toxin-antitoxin module